MKKSIQLIALVAVALLGSCSGGEKDKATAEKVLRSCKDSICPSPS